MCDRCKELMEKVRLDASPIEKFRRKAKNDLSREGLRLAARDAMESEMMSRAITPDDIPDIITAVCGAGVLRSPRADDPLLGIAALPISDETRQLIKELYDKALDETRNYLWVLITHEDTSIKGVISDKGQEALNSLWERISPKTRDYIRSVFTRDSDIIPMEALNEAFGRDDVMTYEGEIC